VYETIEKRGKIFDKMNRIIDEVLFFATGFNSPSYSLEVFAGDDYLQTNIVLSKPPFQRKQVRNIERFWFWCPLWG